MLFVWPVLWAVALFLLAAGSGSSASRRLAAVSFFAGTGALAAVLDLNIIPSLADGAVRDRWEQPLYHMQAIASVASYYGVPYAFLMFALAFRPVRMHPALRRALPAALLAPIALCLLLTPWYTERYPISFGIVVWWAAPYMLYGAAHILLLRPRRSPLSPTYWIVCLAVVPPMLFLLAMSYILPSLGMLRMWVYNAWVASLAVAVFLIGLFSYGFMGIRLLVDRRRLDTTWRAVNAGTAILNHAIKNDAGKLRLFGEKTKRYAEKTGQPELLRDIETMLSASLHMQEMIARVHSRTGDLDLKRSNVSLDSLVRDTLAALEPQLGGIRTRLVLPAREWKADIDAAQLGEALNNIVANAAEAMKGSGGTLTMKLSEGRRELVLEVADTGPGMSRSQRAHALEPFYTTKGGGTNFGLGLPYAYQVMRKHGGTLAIRSKIGQGTSVYMTLPIRSVRARPDHAAPSPAPNAKEAGLDASH
ncbi:sensor histidine kinase [Cohnella hashimotonis]|uniref:histidine kinase n=1 Tax=Cohnella hashimotonis TaxID=2826895 RepID=A0ABT6TUK6_9BACL|nr:HAMP domain-containing sensor histidine kinase [Cohnella hashimotonis]MDI4650414.1 HAMP domain-containing sensor histidine kinase [Cohnella hashimotonis]